MYTLVYNFLNPMYALGLAIAIGTLPMTCTVSPYYNICPFLTLTFDIDNDIR